MLSWDRFTPGCASLSSVLALISVPLWLLLRSEIREASAAHARFAAIDRNIQALQNEQQDFQAEMRQPQNASVLSQSQFLNQLFAHKAFSWTAIMMDLENVLPSGVQVLNIDPVISREGHVTIHLPHVSGERDRAVDLVRNLEHSRRFLSPRVSSESAESAQNGRGVQQAGLTTGGVNFDILAEYNPLPPNATPKSEASEHPAKRSQRRSPPARSPSPAHFARRTITSPASLAKQVRDEGRPKQPDLASSICICWPQPCWLFSISCW